MKALQDAKKDRYSVLVGNIGTVYRGEDPKTAEQVFYEYVQMSRKRYGRAAGEMVTLFGDESGIIRESMGRR
jgi:hypothetical protein